jgi:hypothetical protein
MRMTYTTLSLDEVTAEHAAIARDAATTFGGLDDRQLNWRPDDARWSVAQCFDHLLATNAAMFRSIDAALDPARPRTVWQRLPVLPGLFGSMLIRSQAPGATRKYTAPKPATPSTSAIDGRIVQRFVAQQDEAAARVRALAGRDAARVVMISPFASFVVYSVLDGCRLIVTHQRRHFEQARRVMQEPGFPAGG